MVELLEDYCKRQISKILYKLPLVYIELIIIISYFSLMIAMTGPPNHRHNLKLLQHRVLIIIISYFSLMIANGGLGAPS
jgi:hypothetical protein